MPSNSKLVHWVVWGGLAVVVLAIGFAFVREQSAPAPPRLAKQELPVISQLSDFTLTNQLAQPVGLASFAGKVWFADIIFTRCGGPCPAMTRRMAELKEYFAGEPNVAFVTLTTDPDHDTPKIMQRFAERFGAFHEEDHRWQFLTGSKKEIVRLAVDEMKLIAREKPPGEQATPEDLFIHATLFVAIDQQGRLRGVLESMEDGWKEKAITIVNTLLNES
ncbi:MAG: SCO family protein [Verrucomicrobiota bacterium]|nr:SCO family protein [Verrucomicrobiota bacterium]